MNKFIATLNECAMSCLSDNGNNSSLNQSVGNYLLLLLKYLLDSNIWLCKLDDNYKFNNNNENDNDNSNGNQLLLLKYLDKTNIGLKMA